MLSIQNEKSQALIVYVYDEIEKEATGEAGCWWLHESLKKLESSLKTKFKLDLIVVEGSAQESLSSLIKKYKINRVVWNRLYSKNSINRDSQIKQNFKENGIEVDTFNAHLLNEPWEVQNNSGQYFKVFTPYWRKAFEVFKAKKYQITPINLIKPLPHKEKNKWNFLPSKKWYQKFSNYWDPGEADALTKLKNYLSNDIDNYKESAMYLAQKGYWVFRMGKGAKKRFDIDHPKIFDYAFSDYRSDFLDVWLMANCNFCISTGTGIDAVATIFRRPILMINYIPISNIVSFFISL